jgi:Xaa-Pro aminopeptidase
MQPTLEESQHKFSAMRALLDKHRVDALLLRRVSSFAWATCGAASYVNTATTDGAAALLITHARAVLATNNIEAPRLEQEDELAAQGWEFRVSPWTNPQAGLAQLTVGLRLAADGPFPEAKDISAEMSRLRANLLPQEGKRFKSLSRLCAEAMDAAARAVRPGMRETQLAALLGGEAQSRGVQPIVNLIAVDDRISVYRHPLPTERILDKYAMLVLSGRKWGLVCSISRLVHFGALPADRWDRIQATARVNAALIAHTRPGSSLDEVFTQAQHAYAEVGFPDEWQFHHQGGAAGYEPREYLGQPGSTDLVMVGQAYAWNPTIAGAKMEDTILVGERSNQILTSIPGWPVIAIQVPGYAAEIDCPWVLEL